MGHIRLGSIPKTKKWKAIVADMAGGGDRGSTAASGSSQDVTAIAQQTLDAAQAGLDKAIADAGLRYTFYLLTQIVLAAREKDGQERLKKIGIHLPEEATLFDLTSEFQNAVDDYLSTNGRTTDISEMAQQAAGEAITTLASPRVATLFGSGRSELQTAIRELSTKAGFAKLGQLFFGRFMTRFLNFYLSRITAGLVGTRRLRDVGELSQFNDDLQVHCEQSARIVRDFCGEWYSKTEFQEGIDLDNTSRFMAVALKKLQAELARQGSVL